MLAGPDAAAGLGLQQDDKRIEHGAGIWIQVKPALAGSTDAAPVADQQDASKQIRSDFHAVIAPLVQRRADANQRRRVREQRQLNRDGRAGAGLRRLGTLSREVNLTRSNATSQTTPAMPDLSLSSLIQ